MPETKQTAANVDRDKELMSQLDNLVSVPKDQLHMLIAQNTEYKADIIALVNVFQKFETLFSGKGSALSLMPVILKMVNNDDEMQKLSHIIPIIQKYTQQPANHETNR